MERGSVGVFLAASRITGRGTGLAVFLFAVAAVMLLLAFKPRVWLAFEAWKFKNPESVELREGVVLWSSVSSVIAAVLVAGVGIWILATGDERLCQEALSDLRAAAEGGPSIWDDTDLAERPGLARTASEHGVTLVGHGTSVDVVDEDGDVIGTLSEGGLLADVVVEDRCG